MENRQGQAAAADLKVQTLGLTPAPNVSEGLGKFRPEIPIQRFMRQRGQILVWTHL